MTMAAHAVRDNPPDRQGVSFHNVPVRVFGVFRLEDHILAAQTQALADGVIVQQRHHNMAVNRLN